MSNAATGAFTSSVKRSQDFLARAFPTPKFLAPEALGVDISDASIKWIAFSRGSHMPRTVETWGQISIAEGIVVSGVVKDVARLAEALAEVRKRVPGIRAAHAALPEEAAFVFDLSVPARSSRQQILHVIEFELENRVPIPPSAAVYDFDIIPGNSSAQQEVGVVVFPKDIVESYFAAFEKAGFTLLSLELEASSIARAVSPRFHGEPVALLVDFGLKRTGFAVLKAGVPIFTSTVEVGGEILSRTLVDKLGLSMEEVEVWKNEEGLLPRDGPKSSGLEAVSGAASALGSEVLRHYRYWDTRRDEHGERMSPVSKVYLVGGSANLKGLGDYIAGRVQAEVIRPNVWQNIISFDDYIPPIERHVSLQYATAIGLALRN